MAIASQNIKTLKNPLFELETHLRACEAKMGSEIFFFRQTSLVLMFWSPLG